MADEPPTQASATLLPYAGPAHPDRNYATIFADGIMSVAHGNGLIKLHLFRQDPSFIGDSTNVLTPIAQVVMPYVGFVSAVTFFRRYLEIMKASGAITQELVDQCDAAWSKPKSGEG